MALSRALLLLSLLVESGIWAAPLEFKCPTEKEHFVHENQCQSYFECTDGKLLVQNCPDGFLFDQHSLTCTEAYKTDCGFRFWPDGTSLRMGFKCGEGPSYFPRYENCKKFYMCQNFKVFIDTCPVGESFDAPSRQCKETKLAVCGVEPIRPTSPPETTTPWFEPTTEVVETTSVEAPFVCNVREANFPHKTNCERYIMCFNFLPYDRSCPTRTLFDQTSGKCVPEEEAQCGDTLIPDDATQRLGFTCREGYIIRYPSTYQCQRYYECRNGKAYTATCPEGYLFDEPTRQCLSRFNAICWGVLETTSPWEEWETTTEAWQTTTKDRFTCSKMKGIFFNGELCERYYECFNWLPYDRRCPQGMLLDQFEKMCLPETKAYCGDRRRPEGASSQEPETTTALTPEPTTEAETLPETTMTPEPPTTTQPPTTSPATEEITDSWTTPSTTTTTRSSTSTTPRSTTKRTTTTTGDFEDFDCPEPYGLFPYPSDKTKYWSCTAGQAYLMKCPPPGLIFDEDKRVCVWPNYRG